MFTEIDQLKYTPISNYQLGFQNPVSSVAEGISAFHNDLRILVIFILRFVVYILYYCLQTFKSNARQYNVLTELKVNSDSTEMPTLYDTQPGTKHRITHETFLEII